MTKKTVGRELVDGLQEFAATLKKVVADKGRLDVSRVHIDIKKTRYTPALVKKTREILGASQPVFARFLGVSTKTVQAWEQGHNVPSDMASRWMDEIRGNPAYWIARIQQSTSLKEVS